MPMSKMAEQIQHIDVQEEECETDRGDVVKGGVYFVVELLE
jgi:hypothetical protein